MSSDAEYGFDAAVMNVRLGRRDEAMRLLQEVVWQQPAHADAWDLLARLQSESGDYFASLLYQGHALQAAPGRFDLWHNKGMILASLHKFRAAQDSFRKALELNETFESHFNLGNVLVNEMRVDEAVEHYKRALLLDTTENAQLLVNYGEAMMAVGDWKAGFQHYRHRFNSPGFPPAPRCKYPLWRGEPLDGKTILVFSEQGFGDEIMSLRFVLPLVDLGAKVLLAVRPQMYRLAREFWGEEHTVFLYDDIPEEKKPDYTCALLDVPAFVDMSPATVPGARGYLKAEDRGFRLRMRKGLNVGICWASGKRDLQPYVADFAKAKSLSFQQLASVLHRDGVNLYSLQLTHNDDEAMKALDVVDPMPGTGDFADTAFIIDHLDLVVTVDTSVAHLAGAMGKPTWNLTRFDALWPWMKDFGKTCWYDSMTMYRQERPFDWSAPLGRIREDFKALVETGPLPSRRDAA